MTYYSFSRIREIIFLQIEMKVAAMHKVLGLTDDVGVDAESVPDDFPRPQHFGAVSGVQPKFLAVRYNGKYYSPGCTPPELSSRWKTCEDLAQQLVVKSTESKAGKRCHMSESEILAQYCLRLMKTGRGSDDEIRWVTRRAAELLGWPVPETARATYESNPSPDAG